MKFCKTLTHMMNAAIVLTILQKYMCRLPLETSIFTLELYAILYALLAAFSEATFLVTVADFCTVLVALES